MIKKYIFSIITSVFVASFIFVQGFNADATSKNNRIETSSVASNSTTNVTKKIASSNHAEFVQNRLPQTGVEANHSGLYFSIAGFFLLLAFFTSRSKSSSRYDVSDKQKK